MRQMHLTQDNIQTRATTFSKKWESAGVEMRESQAFLSDFLAVFGITFVPSEQFEYEVQKDTGEHGRIDCLVKGKIAIEMKSRGKNLDEAFEQLKEYVLWLPKEAAPKVLMVCDFETMILDFGKKKAAFKTKDLRKHIDLFDCITEDERKLYLQSQIDANVKAAEKMARLHDALKECGYDGHDLEVYLVRLLFCMFAEDTGIFRKHSFLEFLEGSKKDGSDLATKIAYLFEMLNMPDEERKKKSYHSQELQDFQYINGALFLEKLSFANFTQKTRAALIDCAKFDWSNISPAIFGAMFQGVMNKDIRRALGAHYTSEENILKVINPLFMDDLRAEFERVKNSPTKLNAFHAKISTLKFLDPACGCGNFLIVAYRELRRLELEILKKRYGKNIQLEINILWDMLRVNVEQFYGIEIEEFPCQIALVGMWLMDHQINLEASDLFGCYYERLPLRQCAKIAHGNAIQIDWETKVVSRRKLNYILGNPPFVGARLMSSEQKNDMLDIFGNKFKGAGNLDYVTAWYKKVAQYIRDTNIDCAFVSTNSITQGEQVALLWKPLIEKYNIKITFAYRTFVWSNEAKGKAAVYCVIIGFCISQSCDNLTKETSLFKQHEDGASGQCGKSPVIYDSDGTVTKVRNINPYLVDAPNVFIENRTTPLCDVPEMGIGNKPIDGGHYLFTDDERKEFLKKEPQAKKWFRKWIGSHEFINGYFRYCLWLGDCPREELMNMPECMKRVEAVKQFRLKSKSHGTVKIAETPLRFHVENMPNSNYIAIPETSSEKRKYIPIGFIKPAVLSSNALKLIPNATHYHFGILTSSVHMAWTRAICGRLKSDYRYSKDIVYNNFPWPDVTSEQKKNIEKLAQAVLDARAKEPNSSLADLYDPIFTPLALQKAHRELDKAVMKLYGFCSNLSESDIVAALMGLYKELSAK